MIGINAVSAFVPKTRVSNLNLITEFGIEKDFLTEKIGVLERPQICADWNTSDLATAAVHSLLEKVQLQASVIDAIAIVTQNPDQNIPHVAAMVHGRCGFSEHCAAFDVSLGCSGYVYGLSILRAFMQDNELRRGILVTADPYSRIIDPKDRNSALLFGDAATATLLSDDACWNLGPFTFGTRGADCNAIRVERGKFVMEGRDVFAFAATVVPPELKKLLSIAGITEDDVEIFVVHQGSKFIVKTISDRMDTPISKFFTDIRYTGNTVSSSLPLALVNLMEQGQELRTVALCGFGVGLSWASCLMVRKDAK